MVCVDFKSGLILDFMYATTSIFITWRLRNSCSSWLAAGDFLENTDFPINCRIQTGPPYSLYYLKSDMFPGNVGNRKRNFSGVQVVRLTNTSPWRSSKSGIDTMSRTEPGRLADCCRGRVGASSSHMTSMSMSLVLWPRACISAECWDRASLSWDARHANGAEGFGSWRTGGEEASAAWLKGKGIWFIVLYPSGCSHDLPSLAGTVHTETISIHREIFNISWQHMEHKLSALPY